MESHPYGWLSLLPPIVAIVLAIATRKAVLSLLAGIFCGAMLTTGGHIGQAVYDLCEVHLWPTFADPGKLRVFSFTLLMGSMIGVICRSGGMQGLIGLISPLAKSRRGGQLTTWLLGLVVFFDDYANTMLLGNTLRPVCDRLKISREKLAYLVDSTAAPVAGLALVSTWVAVEIDYVREGIEVLGPDANLSAVDLFLGSIPYRFYVVMSLVFIPMIALFGRDYGPMLAAERRSLAGGASLSAVDTLSVSTDGPNDPPARWYNAVLPIAVTLGVVMLLLYVTGVKNLDPQLDPTTASLRDILGGAASSLSLQYGSLAGLGVAVLLARTQKLLTSKEITEAIVGGLRVVVPAILILWSAGAMSRMTSSKPYAPTAAPIAESDYPFQDHRLYTGDYLQQAFLPEASNNESADDGGLATTVKLLPTAVFLLAAVLSFSTGTSFGTMGILMPMVVTLAHSALLAQNGTVAAQDPILLACVG
ncbi:MAG: Na+/H+ antiporter NhaC family protein, partial [Planctomycetota bacterium]